MESRLDVTVNNKINNRLMNGSDYHFKKIGENKYNVSFSAKNEI